MGAAEDFSQNIQYMLDNKGKKTHAILPLELFEEIFEDYQDSLAIRERRNEATISLEDLEKDLKQDGKL